jgi:hypothetical protein
MEAKLLPEDVLVAFEVETADGSIIRDRIILWQGHIMAGTEGHHIGPNEAPRRMSSSIIAGPRLGRSDLDNPGRSGASPVNF